MTQNIEILNTKLYIGSNYLIVINNRNKLLIDIKKNVYRPINDDLGVFLEWIASGRVIQDFINLKKIKDIDNVVKLIFEMIKMGIVQTEVVEYGIGYPIRRTDAENPLERLFISLTERCNLRCEYCYVYVNEQVNEQLSFEELKKLFDSVIEEGVWKVDLIGGEIFCRSDIDDIFQYLTERKVIINVFTNATLITQKNIDKLVQYSIQKFNISFDSINRELFDSNRGMLGVYDKVMEAITILKNHNKEMSFNVPYVKNEKESIIKTIDFLSSNYSNDIVIYPICPMGRSNNKKIVLDEDYYYVKKYAYQKCKLKGASNVNSSLKTSCGIAEQFLFVESNGNISLCPTLSSKYDNALYIGNVMNSDIKDVWENNPVINKFRFNTCRKSNSCRSYNSCKGGCRSNAYYQAKAIDDIDYAACCLFEERECN